MRTPNWRYAGRNAYGQSVVKAGDRFIHVSSACDSEEADANARLIAAAPDLLARLERAEGALRATLRALDETTPIMNALGGLDLQRVGLSGEDFDTAQDAATEAQHLARRALAASQEGGAE